MNDRLSHALATGFENFIEFLLHHYRLLFVWFFCFMHITLGATYFKPLTSTYSVTLFYLVSVPILIYLSRRFVLQLRMINQQLDYLFISEKHQQKVTLLISLFLYATAVLLPLRKAFVEHFERQIAFSEVSLAAYTLVLVIIVLFFFNKEDVLKLLSGKNSVIVWLNKSVDRFYYPVFLCCVSLLILSNPYIGYSNFAWYLAFAIPVTFLAVYGLFVVHYFVRKFSLTLFIKEEDDIVTNKFEHAKAYYGLLIAISFIVLGFATLIVLARVWGVVWGIEGYTVPQLWKALAEDWVIPVGKDDKLGFIELIKLSAFITSGLVISSLIKKFILVKLFEIFRTEPGVQNTVSRILHYCIITMALILGFTAIKLTQYAMGIGGLLVLGIGLGLKDQIADYLGGFLVLLERPIEIGHYVQTNEYEGKVHSISARSTTLKTAKNFFITIPNRDLISKPIVNWGRGRYAVGCDLKVMVAFDSDPILVKKVLLDLMKSHSMVLRVPAPLVRFEGIESSALYFYCRCYVSSRKLLDMWDLKSDLRFGVIESFRENNISIPFPQTVIHVAHESKDVPGIGGKPKPASGTTPPRSPLEVTFDNKK